MKFLAVLICVVALATAQRPSYAGLSPKIYPELASRFKDSSGQTNTVVNRIGESDSQTTEKIPIDARGDADLVKFLNTWPRENRPFWLLNAEAIERFRDPEGSRRKQQEIRLRSSFDADDDDDDDDLSSLDRKFFD